MSLATNLPERDPEKPPGGTRPPSASIKAPGAGSAGPSANGEDNNTMPSERPATDVSGRLRRSRPPAGRRLARPQDSIQVALTPEQRLLVLDAWRRSGLPAGDFAPLVGVSKHTLYAWKHKFDLQGPAGLLDRPRGSSTGSRLPEVTRRAILMLKEANPHWGCERISALLARGPALPAGPEAVARVLREAGYDLEESPTRPHPDHARSFERARPNQLWQSDLFTFGENKGDADRFR
jgi:transposase